METVPVTIPVPKLLVRLVRLRPFYLVVSSLSGVAVGFLPYFLFQLGASGVRIYDWRVQACLVVIWVVCLVYFSAGGPVVKAIRTAEPAALEPDPPRE